MSIGASPASFRVVLRNRQFTFLWSAQALSQIAQNIINFAVLVKIENLTHSTVQVAVTIVSFTLPSVLFGPIAGVFVDRMDKKSILVSTNILRGVATLGFVIFGKTIPAIYAILFVSSLINQLFGPAEGASIPLLVKREHLLNAMSLFNVTFYSAIFIGFVVIAPAVIKWAGLDVLFFVTVAMYLAAASLCTLLPAKMGHLRQVVPPPPQREGWRASSASQLWTELHEGLSYILKTRELLAAIVQLTLISTLLLILGELGPGFTARVLNLTAEDTAYIFLPMGVGLVIGMVSTGRVTVWIPKQLLTRISVLCMGLVMVAVGISPPLSQVGARIVGHVTQRVPAATWLIVMDLALFLLLGLGAAYVLVPAQTLVQELAGEDIRGRVFSIQYMLGSAFSIIPLLFVGGLADAFGIPDVLTGLGVIVAVPAGFALRGAVKNYQSGRFRQSA